MADRFILPRSLVDTFVKVWNEENDGDLTHDYINCGWCYQFAVVVKRAFPKVNVDIYTDLDGGHCWVKVGDRHYDAHHLRGTKYDLSMSYEENWTGPVSIRRVQNIWRGANSGPVQMGTIHKVIREWKRNSRS